MKVTGKVKPRSTVNPNGPPGEARILEYNPQRRDEILRRTGWPQLEPGSLNLQVPNNAAEDLLTLLPLWAEDGKSVIYPEQWRHIPIARKRYLYYRAKASAKGRDQDVLVRRALVPPYAGLMEVFAAVNLRTYFALADDDALELEIG